MLQFDISDLIDAAETAPDSSGGSIGGSFEITDTAKLKMLVNGEILDKVRSEVASEIPRFDTSAIVVDQISDTAFEISVSPAAVHRDSLYSNSKVNDKTGKYVNGLTDIIALKHFGTGHELEVPIGKRRGYWQSQNVWIKPMSTVGSNFVFGIVHDIKEIIKSAGADAYVKIGEDYDI